MSLAVIADHLASKGRNGDTMLVHMTPEEVKGLHALAVTQGDGLTINPETGLPEANILKRFLPTILGIGATILSGGAITPLMAGLGVGAFETVRTGDLTKGIMAGFGAYGGANLAGAFAGAGTTAGIESAVSAGAPAVSEAEVARLMLETGADKDVIIRQLQREALEKATAEVATRGFGERAMTGLQGLTSEAGRGRFMEAAGGLSGLAKSGYMAAVPVLAGSMVPTTTPMPSSRPGDTGYIRSFQFNPYTQGLQYLGAVPANQIRPAPPAAAPTSTPTPTPTPQEQPPGGYADGGMIADPYMFAQRSEPVVRMASGGIASFAGGGMTKPNIDEFMKKTGADFETAADVLYGVSGSNQDTRNWDAIMSASDPLQAARRATNAMYGGVKQSTYTEGDNTVPMLYSGSGQRLTSQVHRAENFGLGLSGGEKYVFSPQEIEDMNRPVSIPVEPIATAPAPSGTVTGGEVTGGGVITPATTQPGGVAPTFTAPPAVAPGTIGTNVTYGGGTLQQQQNAPLGTAGQGYRGTETMAQVRDEYTRGGGRLGISGYVTPEPVLTGGSKQAYDYLMGRGAYPVAPYTPTGTPIMRPYTDIVSSAGRPPGPTITLPKRPDRATALSVPSGDSGVKTNLGATGNASTPGVGLQTWRNDETGEIFYSPKGGYAPQGAGWRVVNMAKGGLSAIAAAGAAGGGQFDLGSYSDGGRLLRGPGDGVSDSIPATIGGKRPARLADGEFVVPARIVSEIGNGSTEAGARKLYAMMERVQRARAKTTGKGRSKVAKDTRADKYLPA